MMKDKQNINKNPGLTYAGKKYKKMQVITDTDQK